MAILKKKSVFFRVLCSVLAFLLVYNNLEQVQAQPTPFLSVPQSHLLDLSIPYSFPVLRGMRVYPAKPFEFDFVIDSKDRQTLTQKETALLVKYFLTFLTVPQQDIWVNLSPYEKDRIIPNDLALTDAGNTLLLQDKLLKQLSSSLTYPESRLGDKFWKEVYKKTYERFGTTDLPVNTFNKVWIIPDKAVVYDLGDSAFVGETHLKVMLDEDYLALKKNIHGMDEGKMSLHKLTSDITREIILPQLEKEVNEGKNFAPVRQIFYSLILADWFKRALKRNIVSDIYVNKKKIAGISDIDKSSTEVIYKQYLHFFKVGAYNYIREDVDPISQQVVPRKYFSGGFFGGDPAMWCKTLRIFDINAVKDYLAQFTNSFYGVAKIKLFGIGPGGVSYSFADHSMISKATLRTLAWALPMSIALSVVPAHARANALGANHAPAEKTAAGERTSLIIKLNTPIPDAYQDTFRKYLAILKKHVKPDDISVLNGATNIQGEPYNTMDTAYFKANWDSFFNRKIMYWQEQAALLAFQKLHGLREDGQISTETMQALDDADKNRPAKKNLFTPTLFTNTPVKKETSQGTNTKHLTAPDTTTHAAAKATVISTQRRILFNHGLATPETDALLNKHYLLKENDQYYFLPESFILSKKDFQKAMPGFNALEAQAIYDIFYQLLPDDLKAKVDALVAQEKNATHSLYPLAVVDTSYFSTGITRTLKSGPYLNDKDEVQDIFYAGITQDAFKTSLQNQYALDPTLYQLNDTEIGFVYRAFTNAVEQAKEAIKKDSVKTSAAWVSSAVAKAVGNTSANPLLKKQTQDFIKEIPKDVLQNKILKESSPNNYRTSLQHTQHFNHTNKKFFELSGKMATIPVGDTVIARSSGKITGIKVNGDGTLKTEYRSGETICFIQDPVLENKIKQDQVDLKTYQDALKSAETSGATFQEISVALQKVQEAEQQLAQDNRERVLDRIVAKHNLNIIDWKVVNKQNVSSGMRLFDGYDSQMVRFEIEVPDNVNKQVTYFNDIVLTVNGIPAKVFAYDINQTSLQHKLHVSLLVTLASPINPHDSPSVSIKIYDPDGNSEKLNAIVGKASATVNVPKVEEYPLIAPVKGSARFFVAEGDRIRKGQLLAQIENGSYQQELNWVNQDLDNLQTQIKRMSQFLDITGMNLLRAQENGLIARKKALKEQIAQTYIYAPYNGTILSINHQSGVFESGNEVLKMSNGTVFLGSLDNNAPILKFPKSIEINKNERVMIETPQNLRFLGTVVAVNKTPFSYSTAQNDFQSVKVKFLDPQNILWTREAVKVILLQDQEKQSIVGLSLNNNTSSSAGSPPGGPPDHDREFLDHTHQNAHYKIKATSAIGSTHTAANPQNKNLLPAIPQAYFSFSPDSSVTFSQVQDQVKANDFVTGAKAIDTLISKVNEKLPFAKQISFVGGVWMTGNGKVQFLGGLQGAFNNFTGQLSKGTFALGLSLLSQLAGNVVAVINHQARNERDLDVIITKINSYEYQVTAYKVVYQANSLLINIAEAQQRIMQFKAQEKELEKDRKMMQTREQGNLNKPFEIDKLEQDIKDLQLQVLSWKGKEQAWTIELNALRSQSSENFYDNVLVNLPWAMDFPTVTKAQEKDMQERIISQNPEVQVKQAQLQELYQSLKLQRLQKSVQINMTEVGVQGKDFDPDFDAVSGQDFRTSNETTGTNLSFKVKKSIFDGKRRLLDSVLLLKIRQLKMNIAATIQTGQKNVAIASSNIRNLSNAIDTAEDGYRSASKVWQIKYGQVGVIYNLNELKDDYKNMNEWLGKVMDLKVQYYNQLLILWNSGVVTPGKLVVDNQAMISDKAQTSLPVFFKKFAWMVLLAAMPFARLQAQQSNGSFGNDPDKEFAILQGAGPNTSISDQVKNIDNAKRPDATVQEIYKSMTDRADIDFRFFIHAINNAELHKNQEMLSFAYGKLGDAIVDKPEMLKGLAQRIADAKDGLYPDVNSEIADNVFLRMLAYDPKSQASNIFLFSGYWNSEDMARKYNSLSSNDQQSKELKELLYHALLGKQVLNNIEGVFSLGGYKELYGESFVSADDWNKIKIQNLAYESARYVKTATQWWDFEKRDDILKKNLKERAFQGEENLINRNQAGPYNGTLPGTPFSPDPGDNRYFQDLNDYDQEEYIENAHTYGNISDLAHVLLLPTHVREKTLSYLMQTPAGRVLVLKDYLDPSADDDLLKQVQSRNWSDNIGKFAEAMGDPVSNSIVQDAFLKMYTRTSDEKWLDLRLFFFPNFQLQDSMSKNIDPRGARAILREINRRSIILEMEVQDDLKSNDITWWAGKSVRDPDYLGSIESIEEHVKSSTSPQEVENYLKGLKNRYGTKTIDEVIADSNDFAGDIKNNDQNFPKLKWLTKIIFAVIGLFVFAPALHKAMRRSVINFKRKMDINFAIAQLDRDAGETENGDTKKVDNKYLYPITEKDVYKPVLSSLETWRKRVQQWSEQDNYPVEDLIEDLNLINNNALRAIRLMPYSPDLIWSDTKPPKNQDYQKSFVYFISISNYTEKFLKNILKNSNLTDIQRKKVLADIKVLVRSKKYVARFLRFLKRRGSVEEAMGHKRPNEDLGEFYGYGVNVLMRIVYFYQSLWKNSEKGAIREIPDLLDEGNALWPGLYKDPPATLEESVKRFKYVTDYGRRAYRSQEPGEGRLFKQRNINSRKWSMLSLASLLATLFAASMGWVQIAFDSGFLFVIGTFLIYWIPHLQSLSMPWHDEVTRIIKVLENDLDRLLDPHRQYNEKLSTNERIKALSDEEGQEALKVELNPNHVPGVDAIIIIAEKQEDVNAIERYRDSLIGETIRKDIPVEVLFLGTGGSGKAYLEALLEIKNNFETGIYRNKYFGLKSWQDARILFVFHGKDSMDITNIKPAIINGYRAAAGIRAGNIIIYDRKPYYGSIPMKVQSSDINVFISRVNQDDLKELGWVDTDFSENGDPKVKRMLEKLNVQASLNKHLNDPNGDKNIPMMSEEYDLYNEELEQFEALNGIVSLDANAVDMYSRIAKLTNKTKYMHLTSDLLGPVLIKEMYANRLEIEMNAYILKRVELPDMTRKGKLTNGELNLVKENLQEFYDKIANIVSPNFTINAYVPHPLAETGDSAQVSKKDGGIDLNFQPQFIDQFSHVGSTGIQEVGFPNMPAGFRGFNFDIIRFKSQLTFSGAFQLMNS